MWLPPFSPAILDWLLDYDIHPYNSTSQDFDTADILLTQAKAISIEDNFAIGLYQWIQCDYAKLGC